jgi:very-short-patch-repair endonuclease
VNIGGIPEYRFAPPRRWRFDYAWPDKKVAMEIEGGVWIRGRHTRGAGYIRDMEKYNMATKLGWRVFRFTPEQFKRCEHLPVMVEELGK